MPETPQRARLLRDRNVRQIVFGVQDGVLTTLGIVTGVGAGDGNHATIVLTGVVAVIVGALSMGVGDYLGGRTERQVLENALNMEKQEMHDHPLEEFAEQVGFYKTKGFTADEAEMIVRRLEKNPEIWLHEMMRDEFGIDPRDVEDSGIGAAFVMAGSFFGGGLLPLLPYLLNLAPSVSSIASAILAVLALFAIGFGAGRLSGRNPASKGAELVLAGVMVFLASMAAGHFIPALFGHPPVAAGG
jgi:VIT1/CCC1 family predicted Fe2+/Mn2+ transporter